MVKSGLIIGITALVFGFGAAVVSPVCTVCVALLLGGAAGYLAGVYERPLESGEASLRGAGAGALAGVGLVLGGLAGAAVNAGSLAASGAQQLNELFGLPPASPGVVWAAQLLFACCLGVLNVGLLAGVGAGGGALWFARSRRPEAPQEPIPPGL